MKYLIILLAMSSSLFASETKEIREQRAIEHFSGCTRALLMVRPRIKDAERISICKHVFNVRLVDLGLAELQKPYQHMTNGIKYDK